MASQHEQGTDVTGSPVTRGKGARPGEVLGERYEVLERTGKDVFVTDHRAQDQETEKACILRLVNPALLAGTSAGAIVDKLRGAVGMGNRFLPGLVDVDVDDKGRLYVVEAPPEGARLREVLTSRRARGDSLSSKETLPIVASLAAAIAAIPPPFHHGDVRLDRIWLAEDGLSLTFPFVVSVLPPSAVAGATQGDPVMSRTLAPELVRGIASSAADRFGVACVAYECLTGRLPKPGEKAPAELGRVGEILTTLLRAAHQDRPTTLEPLVTAIAEAAGSPVPSLEAGAYRKSRRAVGNPTSGLLLPPDEVVEPTPMGAPTRNRRALMMDTIEETAADLAESTAKVAPMTAEAAAEALGEAARARDSYDDVGLTDKASPLARTGSDENTRPRARRDELSKTRRETPAKAEKGQLPEGAAEGGTQEILAEELEEVPGEATSPRAQKPEKKKKKKKLGEGTQQVRAEDILEVSDADDSPAPSAEGTQQVRAEDILEARSVERSAGGDDRVAPHLLAAALANKEAEPKPDPKAKAKAKAAPSKKGAPKSTPDIDPRLVRAALGVEMDAEPAEPDEVSNAVPLDKKRLPPAPKSAAPAKPVAPPAGRLPPAPRASKPATPKPTPAPPAPAPAPSQPARLPAKPRRDPTPKVVITGEYDADEDSSFGPPEAPSYAAPLAARKSAMGKWILIGAVVLATVIILGGVLIASQRRAEAERERRLQQRFLELQQETGTTPEE